MMNALKHIVSNALAGASVALALLLIFVGYSDRIDPVDYPVLACVGMAFPIIIILNLVFLVAWVFINWRKMFIPLAALAICYEPIHTYFPLNGSEKVPEGTIKLLSYNVCGYTDIDQMGKSSIDSIVDYLKREQADIVCLQEDGGADADKINALYPYNDTLHVNTDPAVCNIIGIHTRFPIEKKEKIELPSTTNGAGAFYLKVGNRTIIVVNNHLESFHLTPSDRKNYKEVLKGEMNSDAAEAETRSLLKKVSEGQAVRAPQAVAVHRYVKSHRNMPVIVCGDFNDTPISYVRRTIAEGLTDCFVETGTGAGISYYRNGFRFRIDHILCSDDFTPYGCKVDNSTRSSDHYPILCWLELDGYFHQRR